MSNFDCCCLAGPFARLAVPLSLAARLEEFPQ